MPLTSLQIGLLLSFSILLASGQVLFKYSAISAPPIDKISKLTALLHNPSLWIALAAYGLSTLLWVYLLQQIPLSKAYPFVATGFIIVPLAGRFLFDESLPDLYWLGVILIIGGIYFAGLQTE